MNYIKLFISFVGALMALAGGLAVGMFIIELITFILYNLFTLNLGPVESIIKAVGYTITVVFFGAIMSYVGYFITLTVADD